MECCSDYRPSLGTSIVLLLLGKPNTMLTNELVALPSPINCQCRIGELPPRLSRVKKNKLLIKFACGPWGIWTSVLHSAVLCLACRRAALPEGCVACCLTEIVECPHLSLAWQPDPPTVCEWWLIHFLKHNYQAGKKMIRKLGQPIKIYSNVPPLFKAEFWSLNNTGVHFVNLFSLQCFPARNPHLHFCLRGLRSPMTCWSM